MNTIERCLMVTRIGPKSLHRNWLDELSNRKFDTVLSCYDASVELWKEEGVFCEFRPGYKVAGYSGFLKERREIWHQYDYICFWDEDLEATTNDINRMFQLCLEGNFKIAQSALTPDSYYSYASLVSQKPWKLRHVNFIEMMCPVFRRDVLEKIEHLYHSKRETGIDLVWCQQVASSPTDFAVLDSVPIRHTEPVGAKKEDNGFDKEQCYDRDIYDLMCAYSVPWFGCIPKSAVLKSGRVVQSKIILFFSALQLFSAVPKQKPVYMRLRFTLIHLKHIAESIMGRVPKREAHTMRWAKPTDLNR